MASTNLQHFAGCKTNGVVALFGRVTTSTSGTVSTSSLDGFTVTKTATKTGRYTITLGQNYNKLLFANAILIGPDDSAITDAKGTQVVIRANDVGGNNNDGTFELQFIDSDSGADAEVQDAAIFLITIWVKNSSV